MRYCIGNWRGKDKPTRLFCVVVDSACVNPSNAGLCFLKAKRRWFEFQIGYSVLPACIGAFTTEEVSLAQ